jgi:tetratricopeptide (TPR) repeat protein
MGRWVAAIVLLVAVLAVGAVGFLNGGPPVPIRVTPGRTIALPLGTALVLAFASGAALLALVALVARTSRALRDWRRARARARHDATVRRVRAGAETLLLDGHADAARARLARAVAGDPRDDLLGLYVGAAEQSGDLAGAIAAVEEARVRAPESPFLARKLGALYAAAGRWDDALAVEGELVGRLHAPGAAAEAETVRGLRLEAAAADPDPAQAVRRLLAITTEHPGFTAGWVTAGDRLRAAGDPAQARRVYEAGAQARPAAVLLDRLAALDAAESRPDHTLRTLRRLRRQHASDAGVLVALAATLLRLDALDDAEAALASWPGDGPVVPALEALRGECARRRGRFEEATAHFARAVDAGRSGHRCGACGHAHDGWAARCASCGRWDTVDGDAAPTDAIASGDLMPSPSRNTVAKHCVTEAPG